MANDIVDFQIVTENIATTLDEKVRIVEGASSPYNFIVIISVISVLVLCKQFAPDRLGCLISMFYHNSDTEKMAREWNPVASFPGLFMGASYTALLALFIQKSFLAFTGSETMYGGSRFWMEAYAFIGAFIIVRYLTINAVGWVFGTRQASQHQAVTHIAMMTSTNIVLLPLILILTFYKSRFCIIFGIITLLIFSLYRIGKTFYDFHFLIKGSTLKIFLYFCTLEIIPISVAVTMAYRLMTTNSVL